MISVTEYAEHVYKYASHATEKHITETVLQPLGLCASYPQLEEELECKTSKQQQEESYVHSLENCNNNSDPYLSIFAIPPCTTNVRLTGHDITSRSHDLASLLNKNKNNKVSDDVNSKSKNEECMKGSSEYCTSRECNCKENTESEKWVVWWWHDIGLPYAAIVIPKLLNEHHKHKNEECSDISSEKLPLVCVDVGCAEAILRGSDVFAPGVMYLSQSHFVEGQPVHVVWVVEEQTEEHCCKSIKTKEENKCGSNTSPKAETKLKTASVSHIHETVLQYHQHHNNKKDNCRVTTDGLHYYNIIGNNNFNKNSSNNVASLSCKTYIVLLAKGIAEMDSRTLSQHSQKGLAVRITWNAFQQPSLLTLEHLFTPHNEHSSSTEKQWQKCEEELYQLLNLYEHTDKLFLQNYSSMVPVSLLVRRLCSLQSQSWKVLDACAAPGGKTSLLISLLQEELKKESNERVISDNGIQCSEYEGIEENDNFTVVACERSRARFATLQHTLYSHFDKKETHNNKNEIEEKKVMGCNANKDKAEVIKIPKDSKDHFLSKVLRLYNVDVNKLSSSASTSKCANNNTLERIQYTNFTGTKDEHTERNVSVNSKEHVCECQNAFDGILLDPPCTGMGLRPRLLPHGSSSAQKEISAAADYQRKLFDSCVRLLRLHDVRNINTSTSDNNNSTINGMNNGVTTNAYELANEQTHKKISYIVYSTCTITIEENEQNVLYFLQRYPFLRLARACNQAEHYLCSNLASTQYANKNSYPINTSTCSTNEVSVIYKHNSELTTRPFLLYDEIMSIQRLRECKEAQQHEQNTDKETYCNKENIKNVESEEHCDEIEKRVEDVTEPILVLRFMPRAEHNITSRYACNKYDCNTIYNVREDGVGFFVAVFETF